MKKIIIFLNQVTMPCFVFSSKRPNFRADQPFIQNPPKLTVYYIYLILLHSLFVLFDNSIQRDENCSELQFWRVILKEITLTGRKRRSRFRPVRNTGQFWFIFRISL